MKTSYLDYFITKGFNLNNIYDFYIRDNTIQILQYLKKIIQINLIIKYNI